MLTTIIVILSILFCFCVVAWVVGIIENAGETKVMSLRTYLRLCKNGDVFDIDQDAGIGYYGKNKGRNWVTPRWTWYPIFFAVLIGDAMHKDVI